MPRDAKPGKEPSWQVYALLHILSRQIPGFGQPGAVGVNLSSKGGGGLPAPWGLCPLGGNVTKRGFMLTWKAAIEYRTTRWLTTIHQVSNLGARRPVVSISRGTSEYTRNAPPCARAHVADGLSARL